MMRSLARRNGWQGKKPGDNSRNLRETSDLSACGHRRRWIRIWDFGIQIPGFAVSWVANAPNHRFSGRTADKRDPAEGLRCRVLWELLRLERARTGHTVDASILYPDGWPSLV